MQRLKAITADPPKGALKLYLQDLRRYPLLSRAAEAELARRVRLDHDPEAIDALVVANLRFVVFVVMKYQNQNVDLDDLIAEGNIALMRAARSFDETRGARFITYAKPGIVHAIVAAQAEQGGVCRIPPKRLRDPQVVPLMWYVSLDEPIRDDPKGPLRTLYDGNVGKRGRDGVFDVKHTPDALVFGDASMFEEALADLAPREAKVIRLYGGLDGEAPMTLEQIGALMDLTRARVGQIKAKAVAQLELVRSERRALALARVKANQKVAAAARARRFYLMTGMTSTRGVA